MLSTFQVGAVRTACDGRDDNRSFLQYIGGDCISEEDVLYKDLVLPLKIWKKGQKTKRI